MIARRPFRCRRPTVDEVLILGTLALGFVICVAAVAFAEPRPKPRPVCITPEQVIDAAIGLSRDLERVRRQAVVSLNTEAVSTIVAARDLIASQAALIATSDRVCP